VFAELIPIQTDQIRRGQQGDSGSTQVEPFFFWRSPDCQFLFSARIIDGQVES